MSYNSWEMAHKKKLLMDWGAAQLLLLLMDRVE